MKTAADSGRPEFCNKYEHDAERACGAGVISDVFKARQQKK